MFVESMLSYQFSTTQGPYNIYVLYSTGARILTFLRLEKMEQGLFDVFNYVTGTFFSKIIFREISEYQWTF